MDNYFKTSNFEYDIEITLKDDSKKIVHYIYKAPENYILSELLDNPKVFEDYKELNSMEDPQIRSFIDKRFDEFVKKYHLYLARWLRKYAEKECKDSYKKK